METYTIINADELRKLCAVPLITGDEYDAKMKEFIDVSTRYHLSEIENKLKEVASLSGKRRSSCGREEEVEIYSTSYSFLVSEMTREQKDFFRGYYICYATEMYESILYNTIYTLRAANYHVNVSNNYAASPRECIYLEISWKTPTFGNCVGVEAKIE